MEKEEVAGVDEHPRPDQPLEINALHVKLEPKVDWNGQVVAVVEEGHAGAATQR